MWFSKKRAECPVAEESRIWLENSLLFLSNKFGFDIITNSYIFTPENINISNYKDLELCYHIVDILSKNYGIEGSLVEFLIFDTPPKTIEMDLGYSITLENSKKNTPAGIYFGKKGEKYQIGIDKNILKEPYYLTAIISHELSHIKLINQIPERVEDEELTDIATLFFGTGIFNANICFIWINNQSGWGYERYGYLTPNEWAYLFALHSYMRDDFSPNWIKFLNKELQASTSKALAYININRDKVMV
mgnify:CR=1 FL=1